MPSTILHLSPSHAAAWATITACVQVLVVLAPLIIGDIGKQYSNNFRSLWGIHLSSSSESSSSNTNTKLIANDDVATGIFWAVSAAVVVVRLTFAMKPTNRLAAKSNAVIHIAILALYLAVSEDALFWNKKISADVLNPTNMMLLVEKVGLLVYMSFNALVFFIFWRDGETLPPSRSVSRSASVASSVSLDAQPKPSSPPSNKKQQVQKQNTTRSSSGRRKK